MNVARGLGLQRVGTKVWTFRHPAGKCLRPAFGVISRKTADHPGANDGVDEWEG
jgi:hypothetical protein